jgi:hypothetical protein
MTERIFEEVAHDLGDWFHRHHHPAHYDQHQTPKETTVSLTTIVQAAEADVASVETAVKNFTEGHLPKLRELASKVGASPLVQIALDLVEVLDPAAEQLAVALLQALATTTQAAPAQTPAEQPAA